MWCRSPTHRNSRSLARERSLRCFMCRGSGARFVVLCVYVFSCLYVVAALIIVEILSELLEIVLTTIRLEEQQLLDGPRHKRRRQEWSPFHIFWYFQCFLSLSLSFLLYELVDSVSAHALCTLIASTHCSVRPLCIRIVTAHFSLARSLHCTYISRLPIRARSVHPFREYPILDFQSTCTASSFPFVVKLTLA